MQCYVCIYVCMWPTITISLRKFSPKGFVAYCIAEIFERLNFQKVSVKMISKNIFETS